MPVITRINPLKSRPGRCTVHLDGRYAFTADERLIARLGLHVGEDVDAARRRQIDQAGLGQKCSDAAARLLGGRALSSSQLRARLLRKGYSPPTVDEVIRSMSRQGYLDDARFAVGRASSAARSRHLGRRRAGQELIKAGVPTDLARRALDEVYEAHDSMAVARELARRKAPALRRLGDAVARRRLYGMLLRRGFTYDEVRPVVDEVLGAEPEASGEG
jgi:regulatory protein